MTGATSDVWEVMSTARTIRRFTDEPVDDAMLTQCLEAATWAPSGANAQAWRFVVLQSPEPRAVVAAAAAHALEVIEPVYGMTRPADDDFSRRARTDRATYELHERAGEFTSVLFAYQRFASASDLLLGGSIYPAMQTGCSLDTSSSDGRGASMEQSVATQLLKSSPSTTGTPLLCTRHLRRKRHEH
jgi:nitroreductase